MVNENYSFPQDHGTGAYPDQEGDPNDAANFGSLIGAVSQTPHIVEGLTFSNLDFSGLSFDVDPGKFYVLADDIAAPNEPVNRDGVGVVNGYTGGTGFALTDNTTNQVFVSYDPTTNDSPSVTVNDTGTPPTDPSVKIGEIDTSGNVTSEQWNLLAEDGTLSYPDYTTATTAINNLDNAVTVYDRKNDQQIVDGKLSATTLEADSATITNTASAGTLEAGGFNFIGEFQTLSDFDAAASSGDRGYITEEQQFARQP